MAVINVVENSEETVMPSKEKEYDGLFREIGAAGVSAAPSAYEDKGVETVLPRTNLTGGIEGSDRVYPPIEYRQFEGEGMVDHKELFGGGGNAKETPREVVPAPAPPAAQAPPAAAAPPPSTKPPVPGVFDSEALNALRSALLSTPAREPAPVEPEPVLHKDSSSNITVRFTSTMGELTAPYTDVVEGDRVVCLVLRDDSEFKYIPPVGVASSITLQWDDGASQRILKVIHAGLSFEREGETMLVMLKDNRV